MKRTILFFFLLFFTGTSMYAHGDLHERIKKVSKQIKLDPDNADLYLKRGELYYHHEDFAKSLKDYNTCKKLGYKGLRLDVNIATIYFRTEKLTTALELLEKILEKDPTNIRTLQLKARSLAKLGQPTEAATIFDQVIELAKFPGPEMFFEASRAWEATGGKLGQTNAIKVMNQGIESLGELDIFYLQIVELNIKHKNYGAALYYQSILINDANRKEAHLVKRANIYLAMNDPANAKKNFIHAKEEISKLKSNLRTTKAMKKLLQSINKELQKLS